MDAGATTHHESEVIQITLLPFPFGQLLTKTTEIQEYLVFTYKNLACGSGTVLQS